MTDKPTPLPIHVLLVEDNPGQVILVRRMLASFPHAVFTLDHALDLESALQLLNKMRPQVILLDLNLPDSMGLDTLRRTREHCPAVPVVVTTVMDDRDTAVAALELGAADFLVKDRIDSHLLGRAILRQAGSDYRVISV
jgi:DNA-binding response OmpR family regulator